VDTRTHTPVRPTWAERARTVLAAAASVSVLWDGGRVDLLGCHHDDAQGDVILTLESTSVLTRAAGRGDRGPGGDLTVRLQLTELCAVNAHQRVRAQVTLAGRLGVSPLPASSRSVPLHLRVTGVTVHEPAADGTGAGRIEPVSVADYRAADPDPLHPGAAEHLQHLSARHPEAIDVLSRLCGTRALIGATRVVPIALDRYGMVLRIERLRGHRDVRLPFRRRIGTGAEAAEEIRHLLTLGVRRRACGR
jgi:hypothetical protein